MKHRRTNTTNLTQRLQESWWPLGPASLAGPAVAIVAVVSLMTWPMLGWPYPQWVQTSAQFHQQFTWAGLIAGTSACWYATVLHIRDRIWIQSHAARAGLPAVTRHLTALTGWFVGAYLAGLLPLVVSTVVAGGIGTADPLAMLSGVLAMTAAVALGYAVGTVVPHTAVVPIVAVGFYALLAVGYTGGERYATVAPVLYLEPELGQGESLPLLMFRISLFGLITIVAAVLAGRTLQHAGIGGRRWRTATDVAVYLALPAVLIAVALFRQPIVFTAHDQQAASCVERHAIRYCVHTENQPRLIDLVRAVDPVIARFGTKPDNLNQVWDQSLTFQPIDADQAHNLEVAWLNPDGTVETQVALAISGNYACSLYAPPNNEQRPEAEIQRISQVAGDINDYLSTGTPAGTLSGMSVADLQRWIAQHQEALRTCTLTPDQLPEAQAR